MATSTLTFTLGNPKNLQNSQPRWVDGTNNRAIHRRVLREAFGNDVYKKTDGTSFSAFSKSNTNKRITPFRMAMNAGDINNTVNSAVDKDILPRPSNQVHVNGSSLSSGYKMFAGSVRTVSDGSYYSGNPKHVYDGSDYVRFKKLQAINRNYNDPTFGGDQHNASQ